MRLYLDDDLSGKIAEIARTAGVDVVSARECGNAGQEDLIHLGHAAGDGRCLVTRNRDHFLSLTVSFFERERPHAGVLIVPYSLPSDRFHQIASALVEYDRTHPEGISPCTIDFLDRSR